LELHRLGAVVVSCGALALGVAACGDDSQDSAAAASADAGASVAKDLSGSIRIDGSSTVQPITEAAVELFSAKAPDVDISVGGIGTGDGFQRFCRGELQIADASRAIQKDEYDACEKKRITPVEVQIGTDGLTVVANRDLAIPGDCITTANLKKLLAPKSKITNFKQLGAGYPDQKASFFTPGTESGTFDFFTSTILGTTKEQRTKDVQTSADDNQIVTGIEGTEGALGYVGFAYADQQRARLKILQVDGGKGCVGPSAATIADGSYAPLSRPLFMYPSTDTAAKPEVEAFIRYVLDNNDKIVKAADYVPATPAQLTRAKANLAGAKPVAVPSE
jgi:phosphate transport system substrate-binding protein